jgi:hypothetical protein
MELNKESLSHLLDEKHPNPQLSILDSYQESQSVKKC